MRQIRPHTSYDDHERYPSAIAAHLDRRAFLRAALSTTAATGAALMTGGATAIAGKQRPKTYRSAVKLTQRYRFRYGNYEVQRIVVQTRSAALVKLLEDPRERAAIEKATRKVLDAHSCADLRQGKRLAKLQRRLAKALATRFRQRRGYGVAAPTVVLFVGVPGVACKGDCAAPVPICKPPAVRSRKRPRK